MVKNKAIAFAFSRKLALFENDEFLSKNKAIAFAFSRKLALFENHEFWSKIRL